jgi:hypothetical protein
MSHNLVIAKSKQCMLLQAARIAESECSADQIDHVVVRATDVWRNAVRRPVFFYATHCIQGVSSAHASVRIRSRLCHVQDSEPCGCRSPALKIGKMYFLMSEGIDVVDRWQ